MNERREWTIWNHLLAGALLTGVATLMWHSVTADDPTIAAIYNASYLIGLCLFGIYVNTV